MEIFENIKDAKGDDEAMGVLVECVRICMKQYYPAISNTVSQIEDNIDMPTTVSYTHLTLPTKRIV